MRNLITLYNAKSGWQTDWLPAFRTLCARIASGPDRLAPNYSFDSLDVNGHMAIHALVDEGADPHPESIRAFAGIYRREWWPSGVWRFQNRTWIRQDRRHALSGACARSNGGDGWFDVADTIGAAQIQYVRMMGANALFLSIEGERAHARLRYLHQRVRPRWRADDLLWRISSTYLPVAPGDTKPSWQPILYADIMCGYDLACEPWFRAGKTPEAWAAA